MEKELWETNKEAWEYKVYEWRVKHQKEPCLLAEDMKKEPYSFLRCHGDFFCDVKNKKIASVCGSDGRRAVALAILGAECTVFDVSEEQRKYALELAHHSNVSIDYEIGDFCKTDLQKFSGQFDFIYSEGGILHYFDDLLLYFKTAFSILTGGGTLILSDYHPFQKTMAVNPPVRNIDATKGNYFAKEIYEGHLPYVKYFPEEIQNNFPKCRLRFYTLSEIFNATIEAGFIIKAFYEHPKKDNFKVPAEYTLIAIKQ